MLREQPAIESVTKDLVARSDALYVDPDEHSDHAFHREEHRLRGSADSKLARVWNGPRVDHVAVTGEISDPVADSCADQ
jgi:hypothetical protein